MNLKPLIERLVERKVGTPGRTLFINMIPADATRGVLLRNPLVGTKINYELPGYYKTEFQLIARAGSYEVGEALIEKAIAALTIGHGERLGNYVFRYSRPQTEPSAYPLSKGNLLEFAVDFDVAFHVHKESEVEQQPDPGAPAQSSQPVDTKPMDTAATVGAVNGV